MHINDLELQKFIDLAGEVGVRVILLNGDGWLEAVANVGSLPASGNTLGDIRQALDTGIPYRWNGSLWVVWISGASVAWGGITGTLASQTDLQTALNGKMPTGAYVLVSRDSALANQVDLGSLTTGILKQTVSGGVSTFTIITDNSTNWNTAYTHSQIITGNPHGTTKADIGLGSVDNTADTAKPVSTAQQTALNLKANLASPTFTGNVTVPTPTAGTDAVNKTYADGLVAGLLDYRGAYNASVNTYPASGGSGAAGAVVKGDMWIISTQGTLGGSIVHVGDSLIANIDSPGQTAANWNALNSNITYVPEDAANKATTMTGNTASNTLYLTAKAIYDWITTLLLASLTAKVTPVDADGVPIMDSAASNVMKFLSFTNLKAFLKTYFDTLYALKAGGISQAFAVSQLEVGHASDTTITRSAAGRIAVEGILIPTVSSVEAITGKTIIDPSNVISQNTTTTSSATPTPTGGSLRNYFTVTALAVGATFAAPTGTPVDGNMLLVRVFSSAAQTLAFNAIYRGGDTTLPPTTIAGKTMFLIFIYNGADAKWDLLSKENNH